MIGLGATAAALAVTAPVAAPVVAAGISGTTLALIAGGTAVAGLGLTALAARQQNIQSEAFAEASAAAQNEAILANLGIAQSKAAVERQKAINRAQRITSLIRVRAGESGIGTGGTTMALLRQADIDVSTNQAIIGRNLANQFASIQSGRSAVRTTQVSPILEGIQGGLAGLQTGLSIGGSVQSLAS